MSAVLVFRLPNYSIWLPPMVQQYSLFEPVDTNHAVVCGAAAMGNGQEQDEEHGIGPGECSHSLCQVVDLGSTCQLPQCAIRFFAELYIFCMPSGVRIEGIAMKSNVWWAGDFKCSMGDIHGVGGLTGSAFGMGLWDTHDGGGGRSVAVVQLSVGTVAASL